VAFSGWVCLEGPACSVLRFRHRAHTNVGGSTPKKITQGRWCHSEQLVHRMVDIDSLASSPPHMQLKTSVSLTTSLQTGHISCGMGLECETMALRVIFAVKVISIRLYPGHRWAVLAIYRPRRRLRAGSEDNRQVSRKLWNWRDISLRLTTSAVGDFHTNSWRCPLGSNFRGDISGDGFPQAGEDGVELLESNRFSGRSFTLVSHSST